MSRYKLDIGWSNFKDNGSCFLFPFVDFDFKDKVLFIGWIWYAIDITILKENK